jgi:hypothetical protein
VIFALLLGGEIYGIVGALVALPILAIVRETVAYLREHLVLEPWGASDPVALVTGAWACPACGEPVEPGDQHCRSCGASLARAEVASGR